MDLHQQAEEDVKRLLAEHGSQLSRIRGQLDLATQEVGAIWEAPNPDFISIDPCVRAGDIRQLAAGREAQRKSNDNKLRLKRVAFAGMHFFTPEGQRIRTRSRPSTKAGAPIRQISYRSLALWDDDLPERPYELSVLMEIDLGTKTLKGAWLAAVDWGKDDKGRQIYYEEEISAPPMEGLNDGPNGAPTPPTPDGSPPSDGFSDLLGDGEEETGADPA